MRKYFGLLLLLLTPVSQAINAERAWNELISVLKTDYAYLDRLDEDFSRLTADFRAQALKATSEQEFIDLAQSFLRNFADPHLNLGPYDTNDYSVYPTGSDIYAQLVDGTAVIIDIKSGSAAFEQGLRPKTVISAIDGLAIEQAIERVAGRVKDKLTPRQQNYALNIALGGKRYQKRTLTVINNNEEHLLSLAASYTSINQLKNGPAVSFKAINGIGYIRFNNGLGNEETVRQFRQALANIKQSHSYIIDLRNTPSGGNTGVAEPVLSHFVSSEQVYQQYQQQADLPYQQTVMKQATVSPQVPLITKPFVVLAGHWTGSMGEGMTIGLDALGAKAVIGAPMADLLGGIKRVELTESGAWLELGFERLYHVNGSYREDFVPEIKLAAADTDEQGQDPALMSALKLLGSSK
ncbi:hypothetical protein tinsulaeT_16000 [Thalassotalea insulae]|uniref:Tail specific protease domain-containing protein n=1 Tax=Thalassotalea insulae TaxID=2056778 RepID=A0ABQ6GUA3_9GAMM|nr:S41 family peptidase [Thalassotalea insulae]GLX78260.1 hypothetical protein tinsulaeT_16000 [Thalassotalea insulae]